MGHMVTMETRVYGIDRTVVVTNPDAVPDKSSGASCIATMPATEHVQPRVASDKGGYPPSKPVLAQDSESLSHSKASAPTHKGVVEMHGDATPDTSNDMAPSQESLSWVLRSSAEIEGDKVKAQVTVKDGIEGADLSLDVASCILRVAHGKEVLEIALPVPVDSSAVPAAKWSKKTRTLTTKLEIQQHA